ncbi:MAG: S9 family peptidase [Acidobacteriota bacterium]
MRLNAQRLLVISGAILFALSLSAAPAKGTHPFSVMDMLAMKRLSDPQLSPDGKWVAFVVRTTDLAANKGVRDVWLVGSDGSGLRQLTTDPANDDTPRWSTDGSLYFLSARGGSSQVWKKSLTDGKELQVTRLPLDVANLMVSPDGSKLVFSLDVFPDGKTLSDTTTRLEKIAKQQSTGRIFDTIFIRHWDTWSDGRRTHLFVLPSSGAGEPVDLMAGFDADTPSKPFGGTEEFTFTPDGKSIVFSMRDAGPSEPWSTNFDLYVAPLDGRSKPVNLTAENKAWDTQPAFSPDGKTLAWLAMERPGFEADRFRIMVRSWPDGQSRALTQSWDRSPSSLTWSPDGRSLYASAPNLGQESLFAVDARTGAAKVIAEKGTVHSPVAAGGRVFYLLESLTHPAELYSVKADGTGAKQLTDINHDEVAAARMGNPEQFTFKGANEDTVYVYVVKPIDCDPSRKYPVAFLIHGGPQGSFGNDFHYRWNPQAYAGRGYATVAVDFHGSTGYGQDFQDAIRGDWGGKPFVDLQKGLTAALARYPWMDDKRVSALGASYGGYMINWIAGNWPDRFRSLVVHDGNLDERMAYYATEELWFPEWEHRGTPWENPESYEKQNPINFVKNWKTPTLVIHSANDYRVVVEQGIATFTALQRKGIPSKFLYFPDENHWIQKPANSILWHNTVLDWLDQWTKK